MDFLDWWVVAKGLITG